MRILLIGNYAPDRQQSMLRYGSLLQRELAARGHAVTLLQPKPHASRGRNVAGGPGKWLGYIDKFLLFPLVLRRACRQVDVVHLCDHSNAMYTRYLRGKPNVVTCHDMLAITSALGEVPQNPVSATGRRLQRMILNGLKRAQRIVCVSTVTQTEMLRVTGRAADTSTVVHNALGFAYSPMPRDAALPLLAKLDGDATLPFFLHVGADSWYKNRLGLLEIFRHLSPSSRLLIVGSPLEPALVRFIARHGLQARVIHRSGLSNEDLRAAYSLAEAFLFPSLYEGFGWPLLEAQACGCPVFASNRPPMTEIGGTAAVYFDPADPEAAAAVIANGLRDRESIRQAGLRNVGRFSVECMIEATVAAYELAIAGRP